MNARSAPQIVQFLGYIVNNPRKARECDFDAEFVLRDSVFSVSFSCNYFPLNCIQQGQKQGQKTNPFPKYHISKHCRTRVK